MSFFGFESPSLIFELIPHGSFSPSLFSRVPSAQCFFFVPINSTTISFEAKLILTTSALLMLHFIP
jgi:hypothetical protein